MSFWSNELSSVKCLNAIFSVFLTLQRANLCVSGGKESVIAADPCSLGPIYTCRDLQTAVECGVSALKSLMYECAFTF